MRRIFIMLLAVALSFDAIAAEAPFMSNVYGRDYELLNGKWNVIVDLYEHGKTRAIYKNRKPQSDEQFYEYSFEGGMRLNVPGDWNSQCPKLEYFEGTVWYARHFDAKVLEENRQFLYFGAVSYRCNVYLNGFKVGSHEGGFTPFQIEVTDKLKMVITL
jgi:beta-glucuronidase